MIDVDDLLKTLASVRPVFHSEADFQHSFAWELHRRYPTAEVRLERVLASTLGLLHVDVFSLIDDRSYVFELIRTEIQNPRGDDNHWDRNIFSPRPRRNHWADTMC